jgi:hypothetical protein
MVNKRTWPEFYFSIHLDDLEERLITEVASTQEKNEAKKREIDEMSQLTSDLRDNQEIEFLKDHDIRRLALLKYFSIIFSILYHFLQCLGYLFAKKKTQLYLSTMILIQADMARVYKA